MKHLSNTKYPDHPWTKCAADLFRLQGHYYLLIVDYYSKFIAVENLQNPQSETVINKCKKVFSQFAIPKELITDNGPEFSSHKFRSLPKTWDILYKTISPHYHQSNGLAGRSIQTVKRTLNKAKLNSKDHLGMLSLNSLPDQNRTSPAEKLFGRNLRTTLPSLIPSTQSTATEKHTITKNLGRNLPEIAAGKTVRIQTDEQNIWGKKYGIVVSQNNRPRSYDILNER